MSRSLTYRQAEVLAEIRRGISAQGYPPTERELASCFGFVPHAAHCHVKALQRKGALLASAVSSVRSKSRGLQVAAPSSGPPHVDITSGTPAQDSAGGRGVAYRVTGVSDVA